MSITNPAQNLKFEKVIPFILKPEELLDPNTNTCVVEPEFYNRIGIKLPGPVL